MRFPVLGLILFCGLLFFPFLGERDLTSSHEARAAQLAQSMLDEGHWLLPHLYDRHVELQKPPLYYWLVALLAMLRGGTVDAWAVRLPAALSALATCLFLFYLGVREKRPLAGLLSALILASCVHFTWLARVGRIDMSLTLTITVALGAFHLGRAMDTVPFNRFFWRALGYTALGIGLLLKGPIALVLPAVVAGALWLVRERRLDWRTSLWWGLPLTLAIAAPWFVWANVQTENKLWEVFFWYHNVERGLGGSEALASHPWWFYGPRALVDLLPWSLLAPLAIHGLLRDRELRQDSAAWIGLIWFGAILLFLSCMQFKRADYLLPAYPGLAIFLGNYLERRWQENTWATKSFRIGFVTLLAVCACGWLTYGARLGASKDQPYRAMAAEIRRQTDGPVVFFRAESHVLAYHLGQPVTTILEWENLEKWARKPRPVYFVMPRACAEEWRIRLPQGLLKEVARSTDCATPPHDRPLIIFRNVAASPSASGIASR